MGIGRDMTQAYIKGLLGKDRSMVLKGKCHDCHADVSIGISLDSNKRVVADGPFWHIEGVGDFTKCLGCFEKDDTLRNFRPCEVFTRVVGYMRPVSQFNLGKKEEYKERVSFKLG